MPNVWKNQKELLGHYWEPEEVLAKLNRHKENHKEFIYLCCASLISGARLSELNYYISEDDYQWMKEKGLQDELRNMPSYRPALRMCDVFFQKDKQGREFMVMSLRTLKQDRKDSKKPISQMRTAKRLVYIPMRKGHYLEPFIKLFIECLEYGGWNKKERGFEVTENEERNNSKEEIFDMKKNRVCILSDKLLGCNFHYLRHLHFYWAVSKEGMSPQMLMKCAGWKSANMALHYSESTAEELKDALWLGDGE